MKTIYITIMSGALVILASCSGNKNAENQTKETVQLEQQRQRMLSAQGAGVEKTLQQAEVAYVTAQARLTGLHTSWCKSASVQNKWQRGR